MTGMPHFIFGVTPDVFGTEEMLLSVTLLTAGLVAGYSMYDAAPPEEKWAIGSSPLPGKIT